MLGYFPEVYPGELVYSIVARLGRHTGLTRPYLNKLLFGKEDQHPRFDLPARLDHLAAQIAPERRLSSRALIMSHTLFPYYAALSDPETAAKALASLEAGHKRHGFAQLAAVVPKPTHLRFCPNCRDDATRRHGEAFWIRDHQLPAVLVCQEHGRMLKASAVPAALRATTYEVADETSCPNDAPDVAKLENEEQFRDLAKLAAFELAILHTGKFDGANADRKRALRQLASDRGLTIKASSVNREKIECAVSNRFGYLSRIWPRAFRQGRSKRYWLSSAFHQRAHRGHPLAWFLVEETLREIKPEVDSAEQRPWPCRNRLAKHAGQFVAAAKLQRNSQSKLGKLYIVTCACGYVYKQAIGSQGELHSPICREYGPLVDDYIKTAVGRGVTIYQAERESGVHKGALIRIADNLGLPAWPDFQRKKPLHPETRRAGRSSPQNEKHIFKGS